MRRFSSSSANGLLSVRIAATVVQSATHVRHEAVSHLGTIKESAEQVRNRTSEKLLELFASEQKEKSPRQSKGLKVERVRRVELPTLCLARTKSTGQNEKTLYKSTRVFPPIPYDSSQK